MFRMLRFNSGAFRYQINRLLQNLSFNTLMGLLTIWTLYGDDIRLAATEKSADMGFLYLISAIFFIFIAEIYMQAFCKPEYCVIPKWNAYPDESVVDVWTRRLSIGSFYFWLDVLATASLLFEITWISGNTFTDGNTLDAKSAITIQACKMVRVVRTVRLLRLIKLSKYFQRNDKDEMEESSVGAAMADLTTRRVIILVLVMVIITPLLQYQSTDYSHAIGIQLIHRIARAAMQNPSLYMGGLNRTVAHVLENEPIISLRLNGKIFYEDSDKLDSLRDGIERISYTYADSELVTLATFNIRETSVQTALFNIYTALFITFLLASGTFVFSVDVKRLVIGPIEQMVALVRKISINPLGVEYTMLGEKQGFLPGMETTIILSTITKIGGLLKVGFGEAGADVIAKNLSGKGNFLGAGTTIRSIFGFCDVRQFTDTTECLQEEVMLFVNRIAHILHGIVVQCSGAANKNIGDAFLLTWKLDKRLPADQVTRLADQALLCFCKTLIELVRYEEFIMNFSTTAMTRLYKRFPDYKVRIGSGLHVGWAIEGAIGSEHKIDATYLSPHVNFTEYLESSTKAYGVPLLLSENFVLLLSKEAASHCRQVDRIRKSEDEEPIGLFTYDADLSVDFPHISAASKRRHIQLHSHGNEHPEGELRTRDFVPQPTRVEVKSHVSMRRSVRRSHRAGELNGPIKSNDKDANKDGHADADDKKIVASSAAPSGLSMRKKSVIEITAMHHRNAAEHTSVRKNSTSQEAVSSGISTRRKSSIEITAMHRSAAEHTSVRKNSTSHETRNERSMRKNSSTQDTNSAAFSTRKPGSVRRPQQSIDAGSHSVRRPRGSDIIVPVNDDDAMFEMEAGQSRMHIKNHYTEDKPPADEAPDIFIRPYKENVWRQDFDLHMLRYKFESYNVKEAWEEAIAEYIKGNWEDCLMILQDIFVVVEGKDGPTNFLIEFINSHNGVAPSDWKGYRDESGGGH